jgi:hypothetical protein
VLFNRISAALLSKKGWLFLLLFILISATCIRVFIDSRQALSQAETLIADDPDIAMASYRQAVEAYLPFNPYSRDAVDALLQIGLNIENSTQHRLLALETLRSGILVIRSFYTPYAEILRTSNLEIASIRAEEAVHIGITALSFEEESAHQLSLLSASLTRSPNSFWSVFLSIFFILWLVSSWFFIRDVSEKETGHKHHMFLKGLLMCLSLVLWLVGLYFV